VTTEPTAGVDLDGFARWLTRHEIAANRRRRYCERVEHYLSWLTSGIDTHVERTQSRYLSVLRRHGADDEELALVRTSLALLSRHQVTACRATWTRQLP
jgi:hypothetical protein